MPKPVNIVGLIRRAGSKRAPQAFGLNFQLDKAFARLAAKSYLLQSLLSIEHECCNSRTKKKNARALLTRASFDCLIVGSFSLPKIADQASEKHERRHLSTIKRRRPRSSSKGFVAGTLLIRSVNGVFSPRFETNGLRRTDTLAAQ